jgi:two-component system chemotaxis response regulator CheB
MSPIHVLFVQAGAASGGASAAAVGADPAVALVGRARDLAAGAALLAELTPDVVMVYGDCADAAARARLGEAAVRVGAVVLDVSPQDSFDALRRRVKEAARGPRPRAARPAPVRPATGRCDARLIAIGASTGGVEALAQLLSAFPKACPPTVIVQHMPPFFTTSFAGRLDSVCAPKVHEAWDGAPLEPGVMYLAPGGETHLEIAWSPARVVRLVAAPPVNRHRPSVDVAFHSVARQLGKAAIGVLLTGMGRDGAEGLKAMRDAGARTIAQDKETSTVYGMPRAALECGAVDKGTPLNLIAQAIFSPESAQKEALEWP